MNEMTTPTDLAQALHTLLGACAFLTIQSDGRGYFESGQNINRFRQAIADGWKALDSAAHERAQPASVPDGFTDAQRLNYLEAHPRLATMVINGHATDCYLYGVSGAAGLRLREIIDACLKAAPQPAKGDENGK